MAWTAFWKQEIVPGRWQEASQGQKEWKQTEKEKGIVPVRIRVPSQRQQRGNIRHLGTLWKGVNLLQFSHTARIRCATATSRFGRAPYASNRNKTTMWASSQLFLFLFEAHGWTVRKLCELSEINKNIIDNSQMPWYHSICRQDSHLTVSADDKRKNKKMKKVVDKTIQPVIIWMSCRENGNNTENLDNWTIDNNPERFFWIIQNKTFMSNLKTVNRNRIAKRFWTGNKHF